MPPKENSEGQISPRTNFLQPFLRVMFNFSRIVVAAPAAAIVGGVVYY